MPSLPPTPLCPLPSSHEHKQHPTQSSAHTGYDLHIELFGMELHGTVIVCEGLFLEMSVPEVLQDELLHFHPRSFQCRLICSFYTNHCIKIKQVNKFR